MIRRLRFVRSKLFWIVLIVAIVLIAFFRLSSPPPSAAQSGERVIENRIPKHIPLKVQIKKEKEHAVRQLSNSDWLKDLVVEVTNESDKPIYFLEIWVRLPEVKKEGTQIGFPLTYGRIQFVDFDVRPNAEDVPIKPKATFTFVISEGEQRGWAAAKHEGKVSDPDKLVLTFVHLNYGDGTGFTHTDGAPYPFKRDPEQLAKCLESPTQQRKSREDTPPGQAR